MLKFKNILEGYFDDDYSEEYGFRERSFDDEKINFSFICSDDVHSLVKDNNTNIYYITYSEDMIDDYYQGYFTQEVDADEDGKYSYWEFNEDTKEKTDESICLFTQHEVAKNHVTSDVERFVDGQLEVFVLMITKDNKNLIYRNFLDLMKECFYEKNK